MRFSARLSVPPIVQWARACATVLTCYNRLFTLKELWHNPFTCRKERHSVHTISWKSPSHQYLLLIQGCEPFYGRGSLFQTKLLKLDTIMHRLAIHDTIQVALPYKRVVR